MKPFNALILILIAFGIGLGIAKLEKSPERTPKETPMETSQKVLYWQAPMNPNYRRDKPGKSPMGMDLVPVYADAQGKESADIVKISGAVENNLSVKIASVIKGNMSKQISTVGYVVADENNIEHIHTFTEGWIEKLNVKTTGENVKEGQLLFELYSPTLLNAQEEYILALTSNNAALIRASEKKLNTLGMNGGQISKLKTTRKPVKLVKQFATQKGIISKLNVREGMYIKPITDVMTIEDLSTIWMIAEVFTRQASWVKIGQSVIAKLPYDPEKKWIGKVDYIYPELNPKTHTLRVRLVFDNPALLIKPNMYANVNIIMTPLKDVLFVPKSAVILTGTGPRVVKSLGAGRYKVVPITLGIETENAYQVLSGLTEGEAIVISGHFLIDSESSLQASFERMTDDAKPAKSKSHPH